MKRWFFFVLPFCMCFCAQAQKTDSYSPADIDAYVNSLGPMRGVYLKLIVDTLTHRLNDPKIVAARALYAWEAKNIDYNTEGAHHPKQNNTTPSATLNTRIATHEGYANLFKTMCDMARINCVIITGLAKFSPSDIGELGKWNDHTWNAIEINGIWYPVDVTWGAGTTDRRFKEFDRSYTDAWFMPNKDLFALSHYPKDKKWQMLDTPINKSNFTFAPIIGPAAVKHEIYPSGSVRGNIRGKSDTSKKMAFEVDDPSRIKSVTVAVKTTKRVPAKYTFEDGIMYVDMPTPTAGTYNITMFVNDTLAYIYEAAVTKSKPRPKPRVVDTAKIAREKQRKEEALAKEKQRKEEAIAKAKQKKQDELDKKQEAAAKAQKKKEDEAAKEQEKKDAEARKRQQAKEKEEARKSNKKS